MHGKRRRRIGSWDDYPYLRVVLAPEYANLPAIELEDVISARFPGASAEELDASVGKFFKDAGNVLGRAAPGMLQGAMSGAAMGSALGPYGMLAGAIGGAALGGYQSYQASGQQPGRPAGKTSPGTGAPAIGPGALASPPGTPSAAGASTPVAPSLPVHSAGPPAGGSTSGAPISRSTSPAHTAPSPTGSASIMPMAGTPAASQLLALLSRPETLRALLSMVMGQIGREDVVVGKTRVPVAAFGNAIAVLGERAAAEQNYWNGGDTETVPAYLVNQFGEFVCDPLDAHARADTLLGLLSQEAYRECWHNDSDRVEIDFDEIDEDDAIYQILVSELEAENDEDEEWDEELEELLG